MKRVVCAAALALAAGTVSADVYGDATGELFDNSFTHLDITSAEVTSDGTNLTFDIQFAGDLDATSWGNYMVAIDSGAGGTADNPWGPRPMDFGGVMIDHWLGTWANDGGSGIGGQVWNWDGAAWNEDAAISGSDDSQHAAGRQIFSVALADLGLSVGDTIFFDIMSSGGGGTDGGVDHLSNAAMSMGNWGETSSSGQFLSYRIVPAPGTMALIGLGGLAAIRRRR